MTLNAAHEGYEYQDLLSAYFILECILEEEESTFLIDKKEYNADKFDDLTIQNKDGVFKKQIKYSNLSNNHTLEKKDLSTNSSYNLALDKLYYSWANNTNKKKLEIRLCLAWNKPNDELLSILKEVYHNPSFKSFKTHSYQIDVEKLWPNGGFPLKSWKRIRQESQHIKRENFIEFCKNLFIETDFPKSSTYIYDPEDLERIVLNQASSLGIGVFPNANLSKEEFILGLISLIKKSRSKGTLITTKEIFSRFQIKTDYGSISQVFPIDKSKNIPLKENVKSLLSLLNINRKIILVGEPGSGKSWFLQNILNVLKEENVASIRHYCYTDIKDELQKERIKTNTFYGNLISDIITNYPELKEKKKYKYASSLSELNLLIESITNPTILIIDGLDHISRLYNYHLYNDLTLSDIEIIKEIKKIKCTKYLSILVASQPIAELKEIKTFKRFSIPEWSKEETKELMDKLYLKDITINNDLLSNFLLKRSAGNPLYLTYLIEEIKLSKSINSELLSKLPTYSYNLENYYKYILSKLNTKELIAQILSVVNFNLTKVELKEITGLGELVDESMDSLLPILKQRTSHSGYIIYHESFRRFMLEHLKAKQVNIKTSIFQLLINWLKTKNFYDFPKAFRYYLQILTDCQQYNEIIKFISKDYIPKSIYYGQSWELISNNYYHLLNGAVHAKNIHKIILLNEINKVLSQNEIVFEEAYQLYIEALGSCHGYKRVSELLYFEGEPTLPIRLGMEVCYLLDDNNIIAPWEYYITYFEKGKPIKINDFKFFIRYNLTSLNREVLNKIIKRLNSSTNIEFISILLDELKKFRNQDFISELKENNKTLNKLIQHFNNNNPAKKDLNILADEILSFDNVFDKETEKIKIFFDQIRLQKEDSTTINLVINKFKAINWFYNWLIYYIKICLIDASSTITSIFLQDAFDYLTYEKDPFKGNPRTCDLYSLSEFIYQSINEGLSLIKKKEDWPAILTILEELSNNTTTHFQKALIGPLTTVKLFKLFYSILNKNNFKTIRDILERIFESKKEHHLHPYLAEYCFQLSKINATFNKNSEVKIYFKLGIRYLLGYTERRDLTLEDLTEGIEGINNLDTEYGNKYIKQIKNLVDSVIAHTDGKDTRHFPIEWFEKYYNINSKDACLYLLNELLDTRYDWRLEKSLNYIILNSKDNIDPLLLSVLSQTILINPSELFITHLIDLYDKSSNTAQQSLITSLIFNNLEIKKSSDFSESFKSQILNFLNNNLIQNIHPYDNLRFKRKSPNNIDPIYRLKNEPINRKEFSVMTIKELTEYFRNTKVRDRDIQSLIYLFDSFTILTPDLKELIQYLAGKKDSYEDKYNLKTGILFRSNKDISIFYWISCFVYQQDGWYKNFVNIEAFKFAYNLNPQKSIEFLFELISTKLKIGFNRVFSANLINALSSVNYRPSAVKKTWSDLFKMIEYRLPSTECYDWEKCLKNNFNLNFEEILICILFTRFKSYTVKRVHTVISGLSVLLQKNPEKCIKPIKWFFINYMYFKDSVCLLVLELIHEFTKTNKLLINHIKPELESLYPTNYFLMDYIIEDLLFLPKKKNIIPSKKLYYHISDKEADFLINLNRRHRILDHAGLDIKNVFGKYASSFSIKYKEYLDLYANRVHKQMVSNLFFSDYILELINKDLYLEFKNYENQDDIYNDIKIDLKSIIAQYNSISIRPKQLLKPSDCEKTAYLTNEILSENGWIRIAHFESELIKDSHYYSSEQKIFGGLTFHKGNNPTFPYSNFRLEIEEVWHNPLNNHEVNEKVIFSFIQRDQQLEEYKLLWLNPTIIDNLKLKTGNYLEGINAKNQDNEIVLKYNSWQSNYLASDYNNSIKDEIPILDGAELKIREDYFKLLCNMFSDIPKYNIFKTF